MKSEHRHELETNELSASLAKWIESIKPYSGQLFTGLAILIIAYLGLIIWGNENLRWEKKAWDAYAMETGSSDPELKGLQKIAGSEEYAGSKMSEWAYVGWADRQVLNAMSYYLVDREKTQDLISEATGIYQGFANNASDPQVKNRARFGLARVFELQNKLDEAKQQYLTVRGDLQPIAVERAEQLDSEEVDAAIAWLAKADLPKLDRTGGQGATGVRPNFDAGLPVAQPSKDGISAKSLEELLGDFENSSTEENRYGEQDEAATADPESEAPASGETDAEADDAAAE